MGVLADETVSQALSHLSPLSSSSSRLRLAQAESKVRMVEMMAAAEKQKAADKQAAAELEQELAAINRKTAAAQSAAAQAAAQAEMLAEEARQKLILERISIDTPNPNVVQGRPGAALGRR